MQRTCIKEIIVPYTVMIERQLNIDSIFQQKIKKRLTFKAAINKGRPKIDSIEAASYDEPDEDGSYLRDKLYLGYFSLAGLSFFTSMIHLFLMLAVIISSFSLKKDIKPNKITQSINVWVPELEHQDIMFPESRALGPNISLADKCRPFIPKTIPYNNAFATIFPKILLYCEIDNRISIALFFFLSFAFQFFKAVNVKAFQEHPCKQELWLGDTFYINLEQGRVSKTHFIEYSISATLMILVMITQIGITDLALIVNVCANTWACMIIGLLAEYIADAEECPELCDQTFRGLRLSFITHILGWIPLISVIFTMITPLSTYKTCIVGKVEIPDFVFVFVVGEIILFCSFGLVQYFSISTLHQIRDEASSDIRRLRRNADKQIKQIDEINYPRNPNRKQHHNLTSYNDTDDSTKQSIEKDFELECAKVKEDKQNKMVENACTAESRYVCLSLFAKTFLALTIYVGINTQP
jgi:hypothetical protein